MIEDQKDWETLRYKHKPAQAYAKRGDFGWRDSRFEFGAAPSRSNTDERAAF